MIPQSQLHVCRDFSPVWVRRGKRTLDKPQEAHKQPDHPCRCPKNRETSLRQPSPGTVCSIQRGGRRMGDVRCCNAQSLTRLPAGMLAVLPNTPIEKGRRDHIEISLKFQSYLTLDEPEGQRLNSPDYFTQSSQVSTAKCCVNSAQVGLLAETSSSP